MKTIIDEIKRLGGFSQMKDFKEAGFHSREVKKSLAEGGIDKVGNGFYRIMDIDFFEDVNFSFLTICRIEPKGIIALASALDYHELTTFTPAQIYYAVPNSKRPVDIYYPPTRVFYFRERFYDIGIEEINTKFGTIKIYNKEKTICDMFRYRNKLGEDLAYEGLKEYLKRKDFDIHRLMHFAEKCQVMGIIKPVLKGVLA